MAIAVRLDPRLAPVGPAVPWPERIAALRRAGPVIVLMLTIFAGLYSGVFTVNEAASVAAVLSLVFALARRRLNGKVLWTGMRDTATATAMIYMIIIGASVFTYFITAAKVPEALIAAIASLTIPPLAVIAIMLAAYLALGAVFDEIAAMLITLPFALPVITNLGYDPIWWGIINVVIIELGMIIPPVGVIVFVLHGMAPDIPMRTIYRGVTPFILADLVLLALIATFPALALWLPALLK
ncbi:MAG: TRAP transporter large permease subunit [Alphaproteobacteria bacterium]|nr:TRAP transporter large permease subunit [Alphaproteobacteria bacterium]